MFEERRNPLKALCLHGSKGSDNDERVKKETNKFLERNSMNGADMIRTLSIEERAKRAMLAEAVEDRMIILSEELDNLLGEDGMPKKKESREEVLNLASQIKAQQEQYRQLVMGERNVLLDTTFKSDQDGFE